LDLEPFGSQYSALYGEKSWNVFIKNLNFLSIEERMTSWIGKLSAKVFFKSELFLGPAYDRV